MEGKQGRTDTHTTPGQGSYFPTPHTHRVEDHVQSDTQTLHPFHRSRHWFETQMTISKAKKGSHPMVSFWYVPSGGKASVVVRPQSLMWWEMVSPTNSPFLLCPLLTEGASNSGWYTAGALSAVTHQGATTTHGKKSIVGRFLHCVRTQDTRQQTKTC